MAGWQTLIKVYAFPDIINWIQNWSEKIVNPAYLYKVLLFQLIHVYIGLYLVIILRDQPIYIAKYVFWNELLHMNFNGSVLINHMTAVKIYIHNCKYT